MELIHSIWKFSEEEWRILIEFEEIPLVPTIKNLYRCNIVLNGLNLNNLPINLPEFNLLHLLWLLKIFVCSNSSSAWIILIKYTY